MIRAALFILALWASAVFGPGIAQAQTGPNTAYSGLTVLNNIIRNTPGITTVATSTGASVSGAAAETVSLASSGLRIPIMVNATAGISAARLASLAAGAMKAGTLIGAATIILPWIAQQTGITVCPPPDFFCKPGPPASVDPPPAPNSWRDDNTGTKYESPSAFCQYQLTIYQKGVPNSIFRLVYPDSNHVRCDMYSSTTANLLLNSNYAHATYQNNMVCPAGTVQSGGQCILGGPVVPATQPDIQTPLQTALGTPANAQATADSLRLSNVALLDANSPVTVTAPSVTTQPQTKTETIVNPDGTTSTKVTTLTSVITPTTTGSTVGNTQITYPATTTVTTTTTNNTTGAVTTYNYTINEYGVPDAPQKMDLPTDYNREITQQKIEADLNADGAPTMPNQTTVITAAKTDSDTKMDQMRTDAGNNMPADENKFWNFLFTPPSGTCSPFPISVAGKSAGTIDICDWVSKLRGLLGWLMALGTAYAVWQNMMRGTDD